MFTFTLYWLDGKREVVEGDDIRHAINRSGYGNGAFKALDFYEMGEDDSYVWNKESRKWERK